MSEAPDSHELARQLVALEGRMNTHQAEYRTDIAKLAASIAERDANKARHDSQERWWQTAIILAGIGVAVTIILAVLG